MTVDLADARTLLHERLTQIDVESEQLRSEHAEDSSELSHYDQHPADDSVGEVQREAAVLAHLEAERAEVEAALDRVREGSYGSCVDCGQPIPEERLRARPSTARCLTDQERFEMVTH